MVVSWQGYNVSNLSDFSLAFTGIKRNKSAVVSIQYFNFEDGDHLHITSIFDITIMDLELTWIY